MSFWPTIFQKGMDFSLLMSIYYKESPIYFQEALESVFAQTLQPSEIVLVKDGPLTPELNAVIEEYSARYPIFKIITNQTNLGLGQALAKGLLACSYEYVARMDTDDSMPADRFEKQLKKITEGYDVVSCWTRAFELEPNNIIAIKHRPEKHEDIVKFAHKRSPISHPGSVLRKQAVIDAGNYQDCYLYEDYHLWVRMIMNGARFYNIQEVLYYLRTSPDLITRRGGWKYMCNEVRTFFFFHRIRFYSRSDLLRNLITHIPVRIMPGWMRRSILLWLWHR